MATPAPKVIPVLISAELMPFSLMEADMMTVGINDLNSEIDRFFEEKGVKIDPAVYLDTTTVYGTAHLPHDHVPYVQVTSGVKIPGTYEEIEALVKDFAPTNFEHFTVRVLTPDDVKVYRAKFVGDYKPPKDEAAE